MSLLDTILPAAERAALLERYGEQLPLFTRLLAENLAVTDEEVLIVTDDGEPGRNAAAKLNALYAVAAQRLGLRIRVAHQRTKLRGDTADHEVVSALNALPERSVILLNLSGRIGNLSRLGLSYRAFCKRRGHRFFSSSNLGLLDDFQLLVDALDVDYAALSAEGARLKERLDAAATVRVTTPAGTDVTFQKRGLRAINNDGFYREPGLGGNMPAGEVYFPPTKKGVNGRIVIDGSYRTKDASLTPQEPLVMEVRDGRIASLNDTPEARALEQTLAWAEERARYPWGIRYIGECGIGLNPGARLAGCTILDEKARNTVHVANGSNKWFGGTIAAIIHLDHVMKDPTVYVDGQPLQ